MSKRLNTTDRRYLLNRLVRMNIQPIHKQRRLLRATGAPTVLEHVVREGADGVEVSVGVVWIWGFGGGADGDWAKENCDQHSVM
jgi:hypothetical protein